jgi:hypothetical protein
MARFIRITFDRPGALIARIIREPSRSERFCERIPVSLYIDRGEGLQFYNSFSDRDAAQFALEEYCSDHARYAIAFTFKTFNSTIQRRRPV